MGIFEKIGRMSIFNAPKIKSPKTGAAMVTGPNEMSKFPCHRAERWSRIVSQMVTRPNTAGGGIDNPFIDFKAQRARRWQGCKDIRLMDATAVEPQHLIGPFVSTGGGLDNFPVSRSFSFDPQHLIGNRPAKERLSLGAWSAHPIQALLHLIGLRK